MMINPTDLAKLNKIPDKRSRFLKRMIELPLVGTLLYHTLTGRSNIELLSPRAIITTHFTAHRRT
mgnify:CR=1 FL=1